MKREIHSLHQDLIHLAQKLQNIEAQFIEKLQHAGTQKIFLYYGYNSLFEYSVKELKLSEANAYNFIAVSRKAKEIPELKNEIKLGNITVSKAKKIAPVINKKNCKLWLEKAKNLPKSKLEKEVAKIAPKTLTPERSKYISENRLELRLGISEELMEDLRRIQDLLSQKQKRSASLEDCLKEMAKDYRDRHDPVRRAQRNLNKEKSQAKNANLRVPGPVGWQRRPLPAQVKHKVILRDNGQCSFIDNKNNRCSSQRWLDIHHVVPISQGGGNNLNNLKLLCFNHHRLVHTQN